MSINLELISKKLLDVRLKVKEHSPESWKELETLCAAIPLTIGTNEIWNAGKDKPCWSNIKVPIGERIASDLSLSPDFSAARLIASAAWEMTRNKAGGKSSTAFSLLGPSANTLYLALTPGD